MRYITWPRTRARAHANNRLFVRNLSETNQCDLGDQNSTPTLWRLQECDSQSRIFAFDFFLRRASWKRNGSISRYLYACSDIHSPVYNTIGVTKNHGKKVITR